MPYCNNCGASLADNAKFCYECGSRVENNSDGGNQAAHIEYRGTLLKCPNCQGAIDKTTSVCPYCGYQFHNVGASRSLKQFTDSLLHAEEKDKSDVIRNYPVPNTSEDIKEFMLMASTNIRDESLPDEIYNAWVVKLEQCKKKADMVITDYDDRKAIDEIYEQTRQFITEKNKQLVRGERIQSTGSVIKQIARLLVPNLGIIAGIILFIVAIPMEKTHEDNSVHLLGGALLLMVSAGTLHKRNAPIIDYLFALAGGGLCMYLGRFIYDDSVNLLGGFATIALAVFGYFRQLSHGSKSDKET